MNRLPFELHTRNGQRAALHVSDLPFRHMTELPLVEPWGRSTSFMVVACRWPRY